MGKQENRAQRREELVGLLAAHVIREGIQSASLRPLAAAAGTSDRMLLYYFENKEDLIQAILIRVAGDLQALLNKLIPAPLTAKKLLPELLVLIRRPDVVPYLRLWIEITALSARGHEPFRAIAGAIGGGFVSWIASRLAVRPQYEAHRQHTAALLYTIIEGSEMLDAIGLENVANRGADEIFRLLR